MIFGSPRGIDKQTWRTAKFESKKDDQIEQALLKFKDSAELERQTRGLTNESLQRLHEFIEKRGPLIERMQDHMEERGSKIQWDEAITGFAELEAIFTTIGMAIGYAFDADPGTSAMAGMGVGAASMFPFMKWLAKKDARRAATKAAIVVKVREIVADEWKRRGQDAQK